MMNAECRIKNDHVTRWTFFVAILSSALCRADTPSDNDRKGRLGTIRFAGNSYALPAHTGDGTWLKLDVLREDCLGGHLILDAHADSGPDLRMDAFALVPKG